MDLGFVSLILFLAVLGGVGFLLLTGLIFAAARPSQNRLRDELTRLHRRLERIEADLAALNERVADMMLMVDDLPKMLITRSAPPETRTESRDGSARDE